LFEPEGQNETPAQITPEVEQFVSSLGSPAEGLAHAGAVGRDCRCVRAVAIGHRAPARSQAHGIRGRMVRHRLPGRAAIMVADSGARSVRLRGVAGRAFWKLSDAAGERLRLDRKGRIGSNPERICGNEF
jgi:hypothetical protein